MQIKNRDGKVIYSGDLDKIKRSIVRANISGADLRSADLRGADLRSADLRSANLRGANLRGADLGVADLRGANLRGANLRGADLGGADLREADLRGADLRGADLRGANIDFSCLPLWCGSKDIIIDEQQAKQLSMHVFNLANKFWPGGLTAEQAGWINGSHRVVDGSFDSFKGGE